MNKSISTLDHAIDLMLDGKIGDAIIGLWAVRRILRDAPPPERGIGSALLMREAIASRNLDGDTMSLPDVRPIRRPKSKDMTCPTCKAKPGAPCTGFTAAGGRGEPTGVPIKTFHEARRAKARAAR